MADDTKSSAEDERDVDFSKLSANAADGVGGDDQTAGGAEQFAALIAERNDLNDKYLRALADAENIRKRAVKERSDLIKYQGEQIIVDLLSVVDDFELALANSGTEIEKFRQGVEMIHKRFLEVLGKWDVRGESAVGRSFDPVKHEAISKVSSPDAEPGSVVNELKKAFFYKDKLIRPGQVIVAVSEND